jgi:hypothetical protein
VRRDRHRCNRGRGCGSSSHFAQLRAALLDDVGNAEGAADLDELTARDHHFATARRRRQHEHRRRGVVVRQDRRFAAEERLAERRQVFVARAAPPSSRSNSRFVYPVTISAPRPTSAASIGARPRFVWMMTPLPLIVRRSVERRGNVASAASRHRAHPLHRTVRAARAGRPGARRPPLSRARGRIRRPAARTMQRKGFARPRGSCAESLQGCGERNLRPLRAI